MNLASREGDQCLFRMSHRMRQAVSAYLELGREMGRGPAVASRHSTEALPPGAVRDLEESLRAQREEQERQVATWWGETDRWLSDGEEEMLRLSVGEVEMALQVMNSIRVGAWERLGRPDLEAGQVPELTEDTLPCIWALQVSDRILFALLEALEAD